MKTLRRMLMTTMLVATATTFVACGGEETDEAVAEDEQGEATQAATIKSGAGAGAGSDGASRTGKSRLPPNSIPELGRNVQRRGSDSAKNRI